MKINRRRIEITQQTETSSATSGATNGLDDRLYALESRRTTAKLGGGERRIESQKKRGKLTARQRLAKLFDDGNFTEIDTFNTHRSTDLGLDRQRFEGDSVVTAWGKVEGRTVFAYAQDFTVLGGSLSQIAAQKISKVMDHAIKVGAPVVGINDSGGARIQEGIDSLAGYGEIFRRNTLASGVIPQITVIAGPSAGGAVYSPAMTDFIFMVESIGQMYITGPDVVRSVTGEDVNHEDLGGAAMHATTSGVAHYAAQDEDTCYAEIRRLLGFLPSNNASSPPAIASEDPVQRRSQSLTSVIPDDPNMPYDVLDVVEEIVDDGDFMQIHAEFARNIVVGFRDEWQALPSASWRTNPTRSLVSWTSMRQIKERASYASATHSTSRSSLLLTSPVSCPAPRKSKAESYGTAQRCSTHTPRQRCRKSR